MPRRPALITLANRRRELLNRLRCQAELRTRAMSASPEIEPTVTPARHRPDESADEWFRVERALGVEVKPAAKAPSVEPINLMRSVEESLAIAQSHQATHHERLMRLLYPPYGIPPAPPKKPYNPLTYGLNVRSVF